MPRRFHLRAWNWNHRDTFMSQYLEQHDKISEQISALNIQDAEISKYTWSFQVPPRSKIQQNIKRIAYGGFCFTGNKFSTGFLSQLDHKWELTFFSSQINIHMSLPSRVSNHFYEVLDSFLHFYSNGSLKGTLDLKFTPDRTFAAPHTLWTCVCTKGLTSVWDDSVDKITIEFQISQEFVAHAEREQPKLPPLCQKAKEFLLDDHLSDIKLRCGKETFTAHKIVLQAQCPKFCKIHIKDIAKDEMVNLTGEIEPASLKLLLEFMYTGEIEALEKMPDYQCWTLFGVAKKYELPTLRLLCEQRMLQKLASDNCLEMYLLAEEHNAELLKDATSSYIKLNARTVFKNRDHFTEYAKKCPEQLHELFTSF